MKAILFGSIGTLVETSDIQRKCFNKAFINEKLKWYWDRETYRELIKKSGGLKRIEEFSKQTGDNVNAQKIWEIKTDLFNKNIYANKRLIRKGVLKIFEYARDKKINLGLVSTTTKKNIDILFKILEGQIEKKDFSFIGNKNLIKKPKPEPDIYIKALDVMGLKKNECIAIEDSVESARSAISAGIECIAFPGIYHDDEDFKYCKMRLSELNISMFNNDY